MMKVESHPEKPRRVCFQEKHDLFFADFNIFDYSERIRSPEPSRHPLVTFGQATPGPS
jgi:hypothetical protein